MAKPQEDCLVMGAAIGYTEQQLMPFLVSLRRSGYRGDVLLLVDRTLARSLRVSPAVERVILLVVPEWFPFKYGLLQRKRIFRWFAKPALFIPWLLVQLLGRLPLAADWRVMLQTWVAQYSSPPTETRFLHFLRFLRRNDYSRVLISDVRDVVFQSEPFAALPRSGLAVGIEARHLTVGSQPHNAEWVRLIYGSRVLQQLSDSPISCSGVTYGDRASMLRYLRLMAGEIVRLNFGATLQPLDQGIHNFILWTRRFGEFQRLELLQSSLATLSAVVEDELLLDPLGRLLNRDGTLVSIVHQYDRVPKLRTALPDSLAAGIGVHVSGREPVR